MARGKTKIAAITLEPVEADEMKNASDLQILLAVGRIGTPTNLSPNRHDSVFWQS